MCSRLCSHAECLVDAGAVTQITILGIEDFTP